MARLSARKMRCPCACLVCHLDDIAEDLPWSNSKELQLPALVGIAAADQRQLGACAMRLLYKHISGMTT